MTDITLKPIKSGYNLQKINDNFEIIESNINTTSIQSANGNNTMAQELDMDSNRILNVPDPFMPTDVVRLKDLSVVDLDGLLIKPVEEFIVLSSGQVDITLTKTTTVWAAFYISSLNTDNGRLTPNEDFTILTATTLTLSNSYPEGTILTVVQNDTSSGEGSFDFAIRREFVHNLPTLSSAITSTSIVAGDSINLKERTTGNGGGAMWDVVLASGVTISTGAPSIGNIVACTGVPTLALVLRIDRIITPEHLGVVADGSIVTAGLQAYANFCIDNNLQFTWGRPQTTGAFYRIDSPLLFSEPCNITSIGKDKGRLACNDCDGIVFTGSVTTPVRVTIEKTYIAQNVRHTITPNTYRAIAFEGSTSSRPFWNNVSDNFFDGFGIVFDCEWIWASHFTRNSASNCGIGLRVVGLSVNNSFYENQLTCNIIGVSMLDGENSKEGWSIHHNLFEGLSVGLAIDFVGGGFCQFNNNICDHQGPGTSILFRSGTIQITGHDIKDNYVAFSSAGLTGIRSLNNVNNSTAWKGMTISNNRVFAYPGSSLLKGIVTDGAFELNNIISYNVVEATGTDFDNFDAVDSYITGNTWRGAGFETSVLCNYESNKGIIITSVVFLTQSIGNNTIYLAGAQPTTGAYVRGDEVKNVTPVKDANGMVLTGWTRLTTSSNHTTNDWGAQYISVISPAI